MKLYFDTGVGDMVKSCRKIRDSVALSLGGLSTQLHEERNGKISVLLLKDILRRKNESKHLEPSVKSHFSLSHWYKGNVKD